MVKSSTQSSSYFNTDKELKNHQKPSKAVISFLLNYSKALEIKRIESSQEIALFKN